MTNKNGFWRWCRNPPEIPKTKHKKLLVGCLICSVLGVSMLVSSVAFYGGFMSGQTSTIALSSAILSVANLAEGPYYIQNVTYQPIAEANNSTVENYDMWMRMIQENPSFEVLSFGGGRGRGYDDVASLNTTVINMGDQNFTVTSIEIYRGDYLFALIEGPFTVNARTVGIVNFQVYNLTELSKIHEQLKTRIYNQENEHNETLFGGQVVYHVILKTAEGVTDTFETFVFPLVSF
ncbi:MAG: hypothetical protein CW716_11645 [Candidatus Bathyarchaeum sp.]|nr:MAG: hypothetical protein CW716_11645 [Candidatus Bathyarchaeum sp.]